SGVWAPASPLNTGRSSHATVRLANGDILAVGGESHNISPYSLASAELYRSSATNRQIPQAITRIRPKLLANGSFQFAFTNTPGAAFSVLTTTNPALPIANWTVLGGVTELSPGQCEFTDLQANNHPERY